MSATRPRTWFAQKRGRRDANHAAIRDGLRKLGHFVVDTAAVGDGVPDLLVWPRAQWIRMSERVEGLLKEPEPTWLELKVRKGKLRAAQIAWHTAALNGGLRVVTVRTLDEALEALRD